MAYGIMELTNGDDYRRVSPLFTGHIYTFGGNDELIVTGRLSPTITLEVESSRNDFDDVLEVYDVQWKPEPGTIRDGLTHIHLGSGLHELTLAGYGIAVDQSYGWGARVDARRLVQGIIELANGAEIQGSNRADSVVVITAGNSSDFFGRAANDIVTLGRSSTAWGGGGSDVITVGSYSLVRGGDDDDTITVDAGSRVHGDAGADRIVTLGNNIRATGGDGDDTITGDGQIVALGGAGADLLVTTGAGGTLDGGDGNDRVVGRDYYTPPSQQEDFSWYYSGSAGSRLFGGAGDDGVGLGGGDRAWGGTGTDRFSAFERAGDAGTIFDLDAAAGETVYLWLDEETASDDFSDVTVTEANGNTIIRQDGQVVLQIMGETGLVVGFRHQDDNHPEDGDYYTDLQGNQLDPATVDVTIDVFEHFWT